MLRLSASQRTFLQEATTRYAKSLEGSPAEEYLAGRGLLAPSLPDRTYLIGYVADPLPGHEMFRGFLAIPYLRWSPGQQLSVVSIRFRCIENHEHQGHGKYMTAPGDRPRLYNTKALLEPTPFVCVTEGELDAGTAQLCGLPTVGVPGADSWQKHYREPFLGYEVVYILSDGDEPGMRFARKVAKEIGNAKILPWPDGEDTNSMFVKHGKQAILDRIPK